MQTPEQIAAEIIDKFSWGSNVMHQGRLVGQQYVVGLAIAEAIKAERLRCADVAHVMARVETSRRRSNAQERYASGRLVMCRDKILGVRSSTSTPTESKT